MASLEVDSRLADVRCGSRWTEVFNLRQGRLDRGLEAAIVHGVVGELSVLDVVEGSKDAGETTGLEAAVLLGSEFAQPSPADRIRPRS